EQTGRASTVDGSPAPHRSRYLLTALGGRSFLIHIVHWSSEAFVIRQAGHVGPPVSPLPSPPKLWPHGFPARSSGPHLQERSGGLPLLRSGIRMVERRLAQRWTQIRYSQM